MFGAARNVLMQNAVISLQLRNELARVGSADRGHVARQLAMIEARSNRADDDGPRSQGSAGASEASNSGSTLR
jgi:hypothetical protein